MMGTVYGYIRLLRPVNMLLCWFSVICGGIIGGRPLTLLAGLATAFGIECPPQWALRVFCGAVSASLILAAGNVLNDICDVSADKINAPDRPLPSGAVTVEGAAVYCVLLAVSGLILSLPLGVSGIFVAVTAVLLLAAYDVKLKGVPLAGNLAVSVLGGFAFVYGGIAGHCTSQALVPAVFALLFHLGREIIKDAADFHGDMEAGFKTAATVLGIGTACRISATVLAVLAVLVMLPTVTGYFGAVYTVCVAFFVCPVLLYSVVSTLKDSSEANLRRISILLKADMPVGIIAVLVGFQGW